jgi:hypothetical protein
MTTPPINNLPDQIAQCALHHYHHILPNNNGGKPQKGREWTVYAAIVAVRSNDATVNVDSREVKCGGTEDTIWVVSCATGSKCTSVQSIVSTLPKTQSKDVSARSHDEAIIQSYNGRIIKDSHAEVLARRGLMAVLWDEIESRLNAPTKAIHKHSKNLLDVSMDNRSSLGLMKFHLKRNITLHMYISDSPCGDATIYEIQKLKDEVSTDKATIDCGGCCEPQFETEINFTGAKLILTDVESDLPTLMSTNDNQYSLSDIITINNAENVNAKSSEASSTIKLGREHIQKLGALRLKSSRSNIPSHLRSTSMSCSDKLVRWGILGMQGSLLMMFIPEPIRLSMICVGRDPRAVDGTQLVALNRALGERISRGLEEVQRQCRNDECLDGMPPMVAVVDRIYESSKAESEYRHTMSLYNNGKRSVCSTDCEPHEIGSNKRARVDSDNDALTLTSDVKPSQENKCNQSLQRKVKKESPCGMSINWYQLLNNVHDTAGAAKNVEIIVGATGLKRGKKPKQPLDVIKSSSRLCRCNFIHRWRRCLELSSQKASDGTQLISRFKDILDTPTSYLQAKQSGIDHGIASNIERVVENGDSPMSGWVRSGIDHDFKIE